MTKRTYSFLELSNIIMEFIVYLLITLLFQVHFSDLTNKKYVIALAISFIVVYTFFIRKKVTFLPLYLLLHLMYLVVPFLLAFQKYDLYIFIFFYIIQFVLAMKFWTSKNKRYYHEVPVICIVLLVVCNECFLPINTLLTVLSFILGTIFLLLHYLRDYFDKSIVFLQVNNTRANFPLNHIIKTNYLYILFLYVSVALIATVANLLGAGNIIVYIKKFIYKLFVKLLKAISISKPDPTLASSTEATSETVISTEGLDDYGYEPSPVIQNILGVIFEILKVILIVALIFGVIYAIYYLFKHHMNRNTVKDDIVENIDTDDDSGKSKLNKLSTFAFGNKSLSNRQKVRRYYQKKVTKIAKKTGLLKGSNTPEEINELISSQTDNNIDELTSMYESVRYTNDTIGDETLNQVKKLYKK